MFNSLSGTITSKLPQSVFLEANGIEWDIACPTLSLDSFGPVGSSARVFTWLSHREDQMRLFGFASVKERDLFLDLMKVEGIGPKQALRILSAITVADLEAALDSGDLGRLQAAPGIGTKTAQKMILALKGKLTSSEPVAVKGVAKSEWSDIVDALVNMGFDRRVSAEKIDAIAAELASSGHERTAPSFEKELFHRAIVAMSS